MYSLFPEIIARRVILEVDFNPFGFFFLPTRLAAQCMIRHVKKQELNGEVVLQLPPKTEEDVPGESWVSWHVS